MFYVYLLHSITDNGFYIGYSADLRRRLIALREDLAAFISAVFVMKYLDDVYEYERDEPEVLEGSKQNLLRFAKAMIAGLWTGQEPRGLLKKETGCFT